MCFKNGIRSLGFNFLKTLNCLADSLGINLEPLQQLFWLATIWNSLDVQMLEVKGRIW